MLHDAQLLQHCIDADAVPPRLPVVVHVRRKVWIASRHACQPKDGKVMHIFLHDDALHPLAHGHLLLQHITRFCERRLLCTHPADLKQAARDPMVHGTKVAAGYPRCKEIRFQGTGGCVEHVIPLFLRDETRVRKHPLN